MAAETVGSWRLDGSVPAQGQRGRWYTLPDGLAVDAFHIWYLGPDSPTLTNVLVTHPRSPVCIAARGTPAAFTHADPHVHYSRVGAIQVFTYDPEASTARRETADVNRLLKRRCVLVPARPPNPTLPSLTLCPDRRRYLIQQTRDAGVIGIVVTALGVGTACAWLVHVRQPPAPDAQSCTLPLGQRATWTWPPRSSASSVPLASAPSRS